ncbi:MAG: S-layer homology domain-containing protein [Actinomycetota bacterium]|nr:S-layer homology domain-containing protein [Actinomycetota bacterium]
MRSRWVVLIALSLSVMSSPAVGATPSVLWDPPLVGEDHIIDRPEGEGWEVTANADPIDPFEWDPLYLIGAEWVRTYTLGTDTIEVWVCEAAGVPLGASVADVVATMDTWIGSYYDEISHGRYNASFIEGGIVVVPDSNLCMSAVEVAAVSHPAISEGAIVAVSGFGSGGWASPDRACAGGDDCTFPTNRRIAVVGGGIVKVTPQGIPDVATTVHELGHMLQFPHSKSGASDDQYDNPIEIMSGNVYPNGNLSFYPFLTLAVNRYAAGWIDPDQVVDVISPDDHQIVELVTYDRAGAQMVAMNDEPGIMMTFEARRQRDWDPIPTEYEGVAVHFIAQTGDACFPTGYGWCFGIDRLHLQGIASPDGTDHVLGVGEYLEIGPFSLEVLERTEDGFVVEVNGDIPRFRDVGTSHAFLSDINWMAEAEITKGCNPPTNDLFCPDGVVTRGQMAAFLVRALGLTDSLNNPFIDDDDSIFQADIEKLAAAGITRGCNPPTNDRFCPDSKVTREQMAAFLVRALDYVDDGGGDLFTDDDGSIFESDIDRMATAGVTRGCNPPTNDSFCPKNYVTRGQMAAFLHRALGGSG